MDGYQLVARAAVAWQAFKAGARVLAGHDRRVERAAAAAAADVRARRRKLENDRGCGC